MAKLTKKEIAFLNQHNIPLSWMFDASEMQPKEYGPAMKEEGKKFAYGVTPCKKATHRIRSRTGDCIQCQTSAIRFSLRHEEDNYLYIAGSRRLKLLKVGVSNDPENRIAIFNYDRPEGSNDWSVLFSAYVAEAGRYEAAVHQELKDYLFPVTYHNKFNSNFEPVTCYECFSANYSEVRGAFMSHISLDAFLASQEKDEASAYDFNRTRK